MLELLMYPVVALYVLLGAGSSIFITIYLFVVLFQKIMNKIRTGASLYA